MAIYNLLQYELFVQEQMTTNFTNISYIGKINTNFRLSNIRVS